MKRQMLAVFKVFYVKVTFTAPAPDASLFCLQAGAVRGGWLS